MRITLNLEEDVLTEVKEIARQRGVSIGKVFSELARQALSQDPFRQRAAVSPYFPDILMGV